MSEWNYDLCSIPQCICCPVPWSCADGFINFCLLIVVLHNVEGFKRVNDCIGKLPLSFVFWLPPTHVCFTCTRLALVKLTSTVSRISPRNQGESTWRGRTKRGHNLDQRLVNAMIWYQKWVLPLSINTLTSEHSCWRPRPWYVCTLWILLQSFNSDVQ